MVLLQDKDITVQELHPLMTAYVHLQGVRLRTTLLPYMKMHYY